MARMKCLYALACTGALLTAPAYAGEITGNGKDIEINGRSPIKARWPAPDRTAAMKLRAAS